VLDGRPFAVQLIVLDGAIRQVHLYPEAPLALADVGARTLPFMDYAWLSDDVVAEARGGDVVRLVVLTEPLAR